MLLMLLAGCDKKERTCQLGRMTISDGSSTPRPSVYSYYDDGRIKSITHPDLTRDSVAYKADSLYVWTRDRNDTLVATLEASLAMGRYIGSGIKKYFDYSGNVLSTENISVQHTAGGQPEAWTIASSSGTVAYSFDFNNSNRATGKRFNGSTQDMAYVFFMSKAINAYDVDYLNLSYSPLMGKSDASLPDSIYIISLPAKDTLRIQFAHYPDKNDYLIKSIRTFLTPAPALETKYITYHYINCTK